MTEFLQSIKSDLLSRRLLPFVALLTVALVAAVAYVVAGGSGGSGASSVASAPSAPSTSVPVLPVSVAPANSNEAVSETPGGVRYQSQGPTRNPFTPLPSPAPAKTASTSSSSSSSSSASSGKSSGSSSSGSSSGGTGTGPSSGGSGTGEPKAPAPAPKKPAKPQLDYDVSVLFGAASTTPGQPATLVPYESLKLGQPFPSKQDVRISFERVTASGNGAIFKLVVPPILHGTGICLPSNSECQTIDLEAGHSEELEYVEADGQLAVYELKVVSIVKKGASAARVEHKAKASDIARTKAVQAIGKASSLQVSGAAHAARL